MTDLSHFRDDLAQSLGPWTFQHSIGTAVVILFTLGLAGWQSFLQWWR